MSKTGGSCVQSMIFNYTRRGLNLHWHWTSSIRSYLGSLKGEFGNAVANFNSLVIVQERKGERKRDEDHGQWSYVELTRLGVIGVVVDMLELNFSL